MDENHEWYDKYLKEEDAYLKETISMLSASNITDRDDMHTYYMKFYDEDAYRDARDEYFRSSIVNAIKSENLDSVRNLYTKTFGETYCVDSLQSIEISDKQKAYLMSLWNIAPLVKEESKDPTASSSKIFADPSLTLLYTNIEHFKEVHISYLDLLGADYRKMIIEMKLSGTEHSSLFRQFLQYLSEL